MARILREDKRKQIKRKSKEKKDTKVNRKQNIFKQIKLK